MQCPCQPQNRLHITRCTNDLRCIAGSQPPVSQSACGISPSQLWDCFSRLNTAGHLERSERPPTTPLITQRTLCDEDRDCEIPQSSSRSRDDKSLRQAQQSL